MKHFRPTNRSFSLVPAPGPGPALAKRFSGILLILILELCLSATALAFSFYDQDLFERSRRTALRGEWAEAAEGFNALLARDPEGPFADDAYFWLGFSYTELGRYGEAGRAYRELLSHFPESSLRPEASLRLARLLEGPLNDDRAAEQFYRDIAPSKKAEPSVRLQAQVGVARIKEKRKDYPAAVEEYKKAEDEAKRAPAPAPAAGRTSAMAVPVPAPSAEEPSSVQVTVQRRAKSRWVFLDENAARSPEGLPYYIDAERLAGAGRSAEAEARLRELIRSHPDFPAMDRALALLARVLDNQGRGDEAAAVLDDAARRYPESETVAKYQRERRTLKALEELKVRPVK